MQNLKKKHPKIRNTTVTERSVSEIVNPIHNAGPQANVISEGSYSRDTRDKKYDSEYRTFQKYGMGDYTMYVSPVVRLSLWV